MLLGVLWMCRWPMVALPQQLSNETSLHVSKGSVPHITLLASGGGQRAAVGLMGSLYQMEKDGLLDSLLYLGGVSGSTWSMSSIYDDPQWSTSMDKAVSRLSGPGVKLEDALAWLGERAKEEHFSLSDIWGVLTSAGIMKQMNKRHLSDEASRNATNPYPIYNAIEKHCFSHGKWFEVSPHEAGFTDLGFFIETSLLGSKFENGELLEKKPEMDMIKLQGQNQTELSKHMVSAATVSCPECCTNRPMGTSFKKSLYCFLMFFPPVSLLTKKVLPKIMTWEWGTTRNFLFQYQDSVVPTCLQSHERFHLIDAGLMINAPYPSFLGEKRDIDLIIAPEYSAGTMFEVCACACVGLNDRILQERDWPKDCYVFEGKENEASIVYMPLFNRRNCKGLSHTYFSTFQGPFSQEKMEFVMETAKANMKNNKETLLEQIHKAVLHRQRKS
uniref:PLA2c domain-containing protein n=1 Tax=Gasterosteus aculeatus aculeatus TaxID=481459 RepID=A0AAQ4RDG3_GASAC